MGCFSSKVSPKVSPKVESSDVPPDAPPNVSVVQDMIQGAPPNVSIVQDLIQGAAPFGSLVMDVARVTAACAPVPWLSPAVALLGDIVKLCATVHQNRNAATYLSEKCQKLCDAIQQCEEKSLPERMVRHRDKIFERLNRVKSKMQEWSEKSWLQMFVDQGNFEADFKVCATHIDDYLQLFVVVVQFDTQARQKEIQEILNADHNAIMEQLADVSFAQRVIESMVRENQDVLKEILAMLRSAKHEIVSDEGRKRMAQNLITLLEFSDLTPAECQLDSKEFQWAGDAPIEGGTKNVDMYKSWYRGRNQYVRIKVIRSVNMLDEHTQERIRREVGLWVNIYATDKGEHILPFYGYFSPDGVRLALVSPWMERGNALEYVEKNNNNLGKYKKLILGIGKGIKVLHSMKHPIIHGNLRAEKVLIGNDWQPRITDFALAKLEGEPTTQTTGLSDSCRWCAPEMFKAKAPVSVKGDVYSFGMTILELYTHKKPYAHLTNLEAYEKKKEGDGLPDRPQDRVPDDRPSIRELLGPAEDENDKEL